MIKRMTVLGVGLAFALSACSGIPNSGQNTAGGAGLGALGGAGLGALIDSNDPVRGALIGGGIGLLAGGAIGAYLDSQQAQLDQQLAGTGASVERQGEKLVIIMPGDITFDLDSARIKPQFTSVLDSVASTLTQYPESYVQVIGHTDSSGSDSYNMQLSTQRANSVGAYLNSRGVAAGRIQVGGAGESQPKASNATSAGRATNRRVEITVIPFNN